MVALVNFHQGCSTIGMRGFWGRREEGRSSKYGEGFETVPSRMHDKLENGVKQLKQQIAIGRGSAMEVSSVSARHLDA